MLDNQLLKTNLRKLVNAVNTCKNFANSFLPRQPAPFSPELHSVSLTNVHSHNVHRVTHHINSHLVSKSCFNHRHEHCQDTDTGKIRTLLRYKDALYTHTVIHRSQRCHDQKKDVQRRDIACDKVWICEARVPLVCSCSPRKARLNKERKKEGKKKKREGYAGCDGKKYPHILARETNASA